ncbi:hypothetical protein PC110_g20388 [Phytophthora cactorum]|uniref:Uncharacterized protein n=1 Tax=Phytophthora cactorum TaxID=29920 RepID=A0A329REP4_9STRA|nr:hypothetical protein PC121_g15181 [Phytophthora cactorum]RAW23175.1 hypothetical protein PC110_g20388 [Phytophthora cactorum]
MAASLVTSASVRLGTTVSVVSETKTCKSIDSLAMTSMHTNIMRRFVVMHLTSVGVGNFPCTQDVILADCMDGNPHGVLRALEATARSHPVCFSKMLDVLGYPYSITFVVAAPYSSFGSVCTSNTTSRYVVAVGFSPFMQSFLGFVVRGVYQSWRWVY